jgi:hypothetical protein
VCICKYPYICKASKWIIFYHRIYNLQIFWRIGPRKKLTMNDICWLISSLIFCSLTWSHYSFDGIANVLAIGPIAISRKFISRKDLLQKAYFCQLYYLCLKYMSVSYPCIIQAKEINPRPRIDLGNHVSILKCTIHEMYSWRV